MLKFSQFTIGKLYRYVRSGYELKLTFYAYNQRDFNSAIDVFSGATKASKFETNDLIVLLGSKDKIDMSVLKDTQWFYVLYNDMVGWVMFRHGDWELAT
jgi:hypothetical protein